MKNKDKEKDNKDSIKVNKSGAVIRTKNVFGKRIGKSNIIILIILVLLAVGGTSFYLNSEKTGEYNKLVEETANVKKQIRKYSVIPTKVSYNIDTIMGALPKTYNESQLIDELVLTASISGLDVIGNNITYSCAVNQDIPESISKVASISNAVRAIRLDVTVYSNDYNDFLLFLDNLYNKEDSSKKMFYIENLSVSGLNSTEDLSKATMNLQLYTFYRPVTEKTESK